MAWKYFNNRLRKLVGYFLPNMDFLLKQVGIIQISSKAGALKTWGQWELLMNNQTRNRRFIWNINEATKYLTGYMEIFF